MKPDPTISLRAGLDALIHGLREIPHLPDDEASKLTLQMKHLHRQFSRVPDSKIKTFSREHQWVIRSLEMGQEAFQAFHFKILPLITGNAKPTVVAIANFVKSAHAFNLIHKPAERSNSEEMDAVNTLLGVAAREEFVRSVKADLMGRVIAYALSGLCEEDVAAFEALDPTLRVAPTRDAFLLSCIEARNSELVYAISAPPAGSNQWNLACTINEDEEPGAGADLNLADTCIVNHAKRTIVFGSISSSIKPHTTQALSAVTIYNALALLVLQKFIAGDPTRPNPYHGYTVEPFYFHTGLFLVDESSTDHATLAQLGFFNLLGEGNPNAICGKSLSQFNVHICGCDTLNLYHAMRLARAKEADEPRGFAAITLNAMTEAAAVLGQPGTVLSSTANGENILHSALESVVSMAENYLINFPVKAANEFLPAERDLFPFLSEHLNAISVKLRADASGMSNRWPGRLNKLAEEYADLSAMKRSIRYGHEASDMMFMWSEAQHAALSSAADLPP